MSSVIKNIAFFGLWSIIFGLLIYLIVNILIGNFTFLKSLVVGMILLLFWKYKIKLTNPKANINK